MTATASIDQNDNTTFVDQMSVDITFANAGDHRTESHHLPALVEQDLCSVLAEELDHWHGLPSSEFETLHLDLGQVPYEDYRGHLIQRLREVLRQSLGQKSGSTSARYANLDKSREIVREARAEDNNQKARGVVSTFKPAQFDEAGHVTQTNLPHSRSGVRGFLEAGDQDDEEGQQGQQGQEREPLYEALFSSLSSLEVAAQKTLMQLLADRHSVPRLQTLPDNFSAHDVRTIPLSRAQLLALLAQSRAFARAAENAAELPLDPGSVRQRQAGDTTGDIRGIAAPPFGTAEEDDRNERLPELSSSLKETLNAIYECDDLKRGAWAKEFGSALAASSPGDKLYELALASGWQLLSAISPTLAALTAPVAKAKKADIHRLGEIMVLVGEAMEHDPAPAHLLAQARVSQLCENLPANLRSRAEKRADIPRLPAAIDHIRTHVAEGIEASRAAPFAAQVLQWEVEQHHVERIRNLLDDKASTQFWLMATFASTLQSGMNDDQQLDGKLLVATLSAISADPAVFSLFVAEFNKLDKLVLARRLHQSFPVEFLRRLTNLLVQLRYPGQGRETIAIATFVVQNRQNTAVWSALLVTLFRSSPLDFSAIANLLAQLSTHSGTRVSAPAMGTTGLERVPGSVESGADPIVEVTRAAASHSEVPTARLVETTRALLAAVAGEFENDRGPAALLQFWSDISDEQRQHITRQLLAPERVVLAGLVNPVASGWLQSIKLTIAIAAQRFGWKAVTRVTGELQLAELAQVLQAADGEAAQVAHANWTRTLVKKLDSTPEDSEVLPQVELEAAAQLIEEETVLADPIVQVLQEQATGLLVPAEAAVARGVEKTRSHHADGDRDSVPQRPVAELDNQAAVREPHAQKVESELTQYAGLVLVAHYLPLLWQRIGVLSEDKSQLLDYPKALGSLYALAGVPIPRYPALDAMVVNLIGGRIELDVPVNLLEAGNQANVESLLTAVLQHWKLTGTSVEGLQQSFIQREGLLQQDEDNLLLTVAPKPFDVLIDRLPWQFSSIRHPWMQQTIMVEWR